MNRMVLFMATWVYTIGSGYYYNHYQLQGNAGNVKDYLSQRGFTDAAIIGIVANMEHESYMNPGQQEHGYNGSVNRGYGLVQWTPARDKILAYAAGAGVNWYDGASQMDYLMLNAPASWFPTSSYNYSWDDYKHLTDMYEATAAFFYNFERGTWTNDLYDYAYNWYGYLYGGVTPPVPPTPPTPPTPPYPPPDPSEEDDLLYLAFKMTKVLK